MTSHADPHLPTPLDRGQREADDAVCPTEAAAGTPRSGEAGAPAEPLPATIGRFLILKRLSRGGFGDVYLAKDPELDRQVALKVPRADRFPNEEAVTKFLAEARTTVQLEHPGVVTVYDVLRIEQRVVIVQRYVPRGDLRARLIAAPLAPEDTVRLLTVIAEVMAFAHQKGFVHRDLKPANILLDDEGRPLVADFGLAIHESVRQFHRGDNAGTRRYRSPEQVRGEAHRLDGRSDIWSLGVMLYEMLGGQLPFGAATAAELDQEILHQEPRPLRQIVPRVPDELDRICRKCLAKRVTDRYASAADLADDLRHWLSAGASASAVQAVIPKSPVVPKGLRCFGEEDADFFLDLLPGPRNREGLPESIRFWKRLLETLDADGTFPVGLLYGPSGCGKSSLVKAGLLPRLSPYVLPIYVEATAQDTEARLLKRLRKLCRGDADDLALPELLGSLREGRWLPQGQKIVLVLDQFEQWLHARRGEQETQLGRALRQCDGGRVQCLILVRDDFWTAMSRFLHELEVRPVDGQNLAFVDLFDPLHARQVLAAFGRAYGRLPRDEAALAPDEQQFLDQAVAQLSEGGKVVCVRLALFADMLKGTPWTLSNLQQVGGAAGLGVNFLEATFSDASAPAQYRALEPAARAVLQALLPEAGTDIKGAMRPQAELIAAAAAARRGPDLEEVLQTLDGELRLITPTDPEGGGFAAETSAGPEPQGRYYQLTHDYLVPSLREWLSRKQRETLRGRAELRLAERAEIWNARPEQRHLPALWEGLSIQLWTRSGNWSEPQRRMMRQTKRYYGVRAILLVLLLVLAGWSGHEIYGRYQAAATVERLLSAEIVDVPNIIRVATPYFPWAQSQLVAALDDPDPKKQLHASLALLPHDPGQLAFLKQRLLESRPEECRVIAELLGPSCEECREEFWSLAGDTAAPAPARFRAACALAVWDQQHARWSRHGDEVAAWLTAENALRLGGWLEILRPVAGSLNQPLRTLYERSERPDVRQNALAVLVETSGESWPQLLELGRIAQRGELAVLAGALRRQGSAVIPALRAELARPFPSQASEAEKDTLAEQRANAGILLCLIGAEHEMWPYLAQAEDPRVRTCLVHGLAAASVDPALLVARLAVEQDASVRRAILWSLGMYEVSVLTRRRCEELAPRLTKILSADPDPGVHSAAEWLLCKWGYDERLAEAKAPLQTQSWRSDRQWYLTSQGHTMAVIPGPVQFRMGSPPADPDREANEPLHEETIDRSYAIATKEVTIGQFRRFAAEHLQEHDLLKGRADPQELELPANRVSLLDAMGYCRWLTEQEGLAEDAMCYEPDADGQLQVRTDWLTRPGYRLPTEAEWEYACRAGTTTRRHFGHGDKYLAAYDWYTANSEGHAHHVGLLLANDLGLFEMYGNVAEWCQNRHSSQATAEFDLHGIELGHILRGGSHAMRSGALRSGFRVSTPRTIHFPSIGSRIARTIPLSAQPGHSASD